MLRKIKSKKKTNITDQTVGQKTPFAIISLGYLLFTTHSI